MFYRKVYLRLLLPYLIMYDTLTRSAPKDVLISRIMKDIVKYTPYSPCCGTNETINYIPYYSSCLDPCSCDPETCGIGKRCCPDVEQKRTSDISSSCMYPVIRGGPLSSRNDPRQYIKNRIRMVHSCLGDYAGSHLQEHCQVYENTSDLNHLIPVISNKTGTIYVNRFCAECNNDDHFEEFQAAFVCSYDLLKYENWKMLAGMRTTDYQFELIEAGLCVYVFKPSNEEIIKTNKCMVPEIMTCNQSRRWDFIDPFLVEACGAYELPFSHLNREYRNIHCFMCNGKEKDVLSEEFYKKFITKHACDGVLHHVLQQSFFSIIDLDHYLKVEAARQLTDNLASGNMQCDFQSINIFDPYMDICRAVNCPVFQLPYGNKCVEIYSGFQFIPKGAAILFKEVNKTEQYHNPLADVTNVTGIIMKELLSKFLDVKGLCQMKIYRKDQTSEFEPVQTEFILVFEWVSPQERNVVPKALKELFHPVLKPVSIPFTSGIFNISLISSYIHDQNKLSRRHGSFTRIYKKFFPYYRKCVKVLHISKLVTCKTISLLSSVYEITAGDIVLQSGRTVKLPEAYFISEKDITLCLDDYINDTETVMKPAIVQQGLALREVIIMFSFVCSLISIACLCFSIITYILFKELRSLPGRINCFLCIFLFLAQIFQQFTLDLTQHQIVCIISGALIHFFWLSTLFWMNASSYNLFRHFSPANLTRQNTQIDFWVYFVYVLAASSTLIVSNVIYSVFTSNATSFGYGPELCYVSSKTGLLYTFVVPAACIVLLNGSFLLVTIRRISQSPKINRTDSSNNRNNVLIYLKMSTLTGICWLFGFLRIWTKLDIFEILFIFTNASQGLFLMLSFVCNRRVFSYYKSFMSKEHV